MWENIIVLSLVYRKSLQFGSILLITDILLSRVHSFCFQCSTSVYRSLFVIFLLLLYYLSIDLRLPITSQFNFVYFQKLKQWTHQLLSLMLLKIGMHFQIAKKKKLKWPRRIQSWSKTTYEKYVSFNIININSIYKRHTFL